MWSLFWKVIHFKLCVLCLGASLLYVESWPAVLTLFFFVYFLFHNNCISFPRSLSATTSAVWQHFTRTAEDNTRATCHTCKKTYAVPGGGTTSSLKNHLKIKHPDLFKSLEESNEAKSNLIKKIAAESEQPSVDPKQRKLEETSKLLTKQSMMLLLTS